MNEEQKQEEQKQEERDPQQEEPPYIDEDYARWQKEIDAEEKRLQKRFYERW
jgi:hypothetical protein